MKVKDIGINTIEWSAAGSTIEIGFAQSESDGRDDDWTLTEARLTVSNEEIEPYIKPIAERFNQQIRGAVEMEAGLPISPEVPANKHATT